MTVEDAGDWSTYESGPFCRHFSHPADCEQRCEACGVECRHHAEATRDDHEFVEESKR